MTYSSIHVKSKPKYNIKVDDFLNIQANFYWKDRQGMHLGCNDHAARDTGLRSRQDYCGLTIYDISKKETADTIAKLDNEIIRTGQSRITIESSNALLVPDAVYVSMKFPLFNEKGKVVGLFGISTKIQDQQFQFDLNLLNDNKLLNKFSSSEKGLLNTLSRSTKPLSKRETEVVSYLVQAKSAKSIAHILSISTRTVETHIENIKSKWCCRTTVEIVKLAIMKGF